MMVSIAVRAITHDPLGLSVIPNCSAMQSLWTVSVPVQEWSFFCAIDLISLDGVR